LDHLINPPVERWKGGFGQEDSSGEAEDEPGKLIVQAVIWVERTGQKAIVIGKAGSRLKQVGTRARKEIELLLGVPIYLDIRVKVAKDWQKDPKQLRRLGF
jgi:GTP-binding protein Era